MTARRMDRSFARPRGYRGIRSARGLNIGHLRGIIYTATPSRRSVISGCPSSAISQAVDDGGP
jgi:hypothetical protein